MFQIWWCCLINFLFSMYDTWQHIWYDLIIICLCCTYLVAIQMHTNAYTPFRNNRKSMLSMHIKGCFYVYICFLFFNLNCWWYRCSVIFSPADVSCAPISYDDNHVPVPYSSYTRPMQAFWQIVSNNTGLKLMGEDEKVPPKKNCLLLEKNKAVKASVSRGIWKVCSVPTSLLLPHPLLHSLTLTFSRSLAPTFSSLHLSSTLAVSAFSSISLSSVLLCGLLKRSWHQALGLCLDGQEGWRSDRSIWR